MADRAVPPAPSIRHLSRNVAVYVGAALLNRAVSFLLLPLYTRYLTPADYGVLQLLDMLVEMTNILFAAGTTAGMQRLFFRSRDESHRRAVVFSTFALHIGLTLAGALLVLALASPLKGLFLGNAGSPLLVRIAAANFVLGALSITPLLYAQTEQRPVLYATVMLVKLLLQVAANVFFIVHLELGVRGALYGSFVAQGAIGLGMAAWLMTRTRLKLDRGAVRELRRFGVPYQLTFGASFILAFGDRFFLERWHGVAVVGLYGIAYQFGFILHELTTAVFNRAWVPQRYQLSHQPREVRDAEYNRAFLFFNLLLLTGATGIGLFARPAIRIMTTPAFYTASRVVPVVVAAYVVQSWGEVVKFGIDVSGKTRYVSLASWVAVAAILVLYATLIPPFAAMGAAVATLLAFVVRAGALHYWSQRLWPVGYDWRPALVIGAAAVGVNLVHALYQAPGLVGDLLVSAGLFALYLVLVVALAVPAAQRRMLFQLVRSPASFRRIFA